MVVNYLLERLASDIDVIQQLAFQATVFARNDKIDQFGHLDILGDVVVAEQFVAKIVVAVAEKAFQTVACRHRDVGVGPAPVARMPVRDMNPVIDVQMGQNTLEFCGSVVDEDLLEERVVFGDVLYIVVSEPI